MEPVPDIIDEIDRERIERSRRMTPSQRMLVGGELFDAVVQRMTDGIRMQYPDASPEKVQTILRERLAIARRLEECG